MKHQKYHSLRTNSNSDHRNRVREEFEGTKGVIKICILKKNRQHNGQKKKYKRKTIKIGPPSSLVCMTAHFPGQLVKVNFIVCVSSNGNEALGLARQGFLTREEPLLQQREGSSYSAEEDDWYKSCVIFNIGPAVKTNA